MGRGRIGRTVAATGLGAALVLTALSPGAVADGDPVFEDPLPDEFDDPFDEPDVVPPGPDDDDLPWDDAEVLAALDVAAATGEPVEVESARSEWDTVFAEPSGEFTLETSAGAVRTRVGAPDGAWRDIDVSLEVTPSGVRPVAPALQLEFSAGGDGPLAVIERDGHALEMSWPDELPIPEIDGSQVIYRDVFPEVDLVVSVFPDGTGFSEVLVVYSPEAAENPALAELDLGLEVSGDVELFADDSGGFLVADPVGEQVFVSPPAVMWDSSGELDGEFEVEGFGTLSDGGGDQGAEVAAERSRRPLEGDRVAEVAAEVTNGSISLVPDQEMLTDPDTVWPVYIDPSVSGSRNRWTMIQSGVPNSTAGYKFSGDEGLGRCQVSVVASCNVNNTKRLAWRFTGLSSVRGGTVSAATFSAFGTHSWDCSARYVRAYRVNEISSSSTWANRSGWSEARYLTRRNVAHKPACSSAKDRWIEFNVKSAAQWAADNSNSLNIGLRAEDESSMQLGWKRYRYDAKLSITFNHPPNKPTDLRTTSPTTACEHPNGRPWINDNTPVLRAKITDPNGDNVLGRFAWSKLGSDGTWGSWKYGESGSGSSGTERSYQLPSLSDGQWRWRVRGYDGTSYGDYSTGPYSLYCYFEVDTKPPAAPSISISSPYVLDQWQALGSRPQATLTIGRGSDTSVDRFVYSIGSSTPTTTKSILPLPGTVTFTPSYGVTTISARLVDKAGNQGPIRTVVLKLSSPTAQHGWMMNNGAGSTTPDAARPAARAMDLTFGPGVSWDTGNRADEGNEEWDRALRFNGAGSGATSSGPGVFPPESFTVSARARLDSVEPVGDFFVAVSQDGPSNSVFKLGYHVGNGNWAAWFHTTGESSGAWRYLHSSVGLKDEMGPGGEPCGEFPFPDCDGVPDWEHLALVYDAPTKKTRLYVDGVLAAEGTATDYLDWAHHGGKLRIGRGQTGGSQNGNVPGKVDDVVIFHAALNAQQIQQLVGVEDADQLEFMRDEL